MEFISNEIDAMNNMKKFILKDPIILQNGLPCYNKNLSGTEYVEGLPVKETFKTVISICILITDPCLIADVIMLLNEGRVRIFTRLSTFGTALLLYDLR